MKETVEEKAKNYSANKLSQLGFIAGFEKAQETLYTEEEVFDLLQKALAHKDDGEIGNLVTAQGEIRTANLNSWFNKYKK